MNEDKIVNVKYRSFEIWYDSKPIPCRKNDYNAIWSEFGGDDGYFTGASVEDLKSDIDEFWEEREAEDKI